MSASLGLEGISFGLDSCLSAEEVYLLDKRSFRETDSSGSIQSHSAIVAGFRAIRQKEKEVQYFIAMPIGINYLHAGVSPLLAIQNVSWQGIYLFGSCLKTYPGEGGQAPPLRGIKRSGSSVIPQRALRCVQPQ